jgi:hypothetical protein
MANLPAALCPVTSEPFSLSDGRVFGVPKTSPAFPPWSGAPLPYTFGGKAVLEYRGAPCFAEIVILRLLIVAGWSARWVVTYGAPAMCPRLLTTWSDGGLKAQAHEPIPDPSIQAQLDTVALANGGTYSGCWDVVAWPEGRLLFAESKRKGRDRLRDRQRRWFAAAMGAGVPLESFLVVEWSMA